MSNPIKLKSVAARVYRAPVDNPVTTSFGIMRDRPMVLVRVEDVDGVVGWGEAWCNFPQVGAEHRARLIDGILAPIAILSEFDDPASLFARLTARTEVLALQSAEPGPFAQAIAGIDTAVWDLHARREGLPLWRALGGSSPRMAVYASGLNPTAPEVLAARMRREGHRVFKLKIGFGRERDHANLTALRKELGDGTRLLVDANQAWTLEEALVEAPRLEEFQLGWLEEPIRADRPWTDWRHLKEATRIPLAAGENLLGHTAFDAALGADVLRYVQPDLAKWGGITACRGVAQRIRKAGATYCPHYLGGGIGLLASAHLLAAIGGDGLLEIDSNPNPLRSLLCGPVANVADGGIALDDRPGLGIDPDLGSIERWRVSH